MTAIPRALLVLALFAATLAPLPFAAAGDCVEVNTTTFSEGFRIIANAGRSIALGFRTGEPGDGLGFVVEITPALCTGVGVGAFDLSGVESIDPEATAADLQSEIPTFLPLP